MHIELFSSSTVCSITITQQEQDLNLTRKQVKLWTKPFQRNNSEIVIYFNTTSNLLIARETVTTYTFNNKNEATKWKITSFQLAALNLVTRVNIKPRK